MSLVRTMEIALLRMMIECFSLFQLDSTAHSWSIPGEGRPGLRVLQQDSVHYVAQDRYIAFPHCP